MLILNSLLFGFSLLWHSVVFFLCIFSFCKTENSIVSAIRKREKYENKSNINKNMRRYLLFKKKDVSSVDERIRKK